jgi:hypothetical protein
MNTESSTTVNRRRTARRVKSLGLALAVVLGVFIGRLCLR